MARSLRPKIGNSLNSLLDKDLRYDILLNNDRYLTKMNFSADAHLAQATRPDTWRRASRPASRALAFSAVMAARILVAMLAAVMIRLIPSVDTNSAVVICGRQSNSQIAVNHMVSESGEAAITVPCRNPVWHPQSRALPTAAAANVAAFPGSRNAGREHLPVLNLSAR